MREEGGLDGKVGLEMGGGELIRRKMRPEFSGSF